MSSRIDFVPYPPTSFPFRDLLVLEQLPLDAHDAVCEIGIGSGGTTARLARMCGSVVGFEISNQTVDVLRYLEDRHKNLRLVVADSTDPAQVTQYEGKFTRAIACDTLEHVNDPAAFFKTLGRLLAPGGQFLVTFPNEPLAKMHGVTRFDTPKDLESIVVQAGLTDVRLGAAKLQSSAEKVAQSFGWGPLKMVRKVFRRGGGLKKKDDHAHGAEAAPPPQTFEQTNFMRGIKTWQKLAPAVNLYWFGVLKLMERNGPAFAIDWDFKSSNFNDCQVFVTGRKPNTPPGKA